MAKHLTLTALLVLTFALLGFSQKTGVVTGKLVDGTTDEPLSYANVYIDIEGNTLGTVTDVNGRYRIENVPIGEQTVVASFLGFGQEEATVEVIAGEVVEAPPITLESQTVINEEIIVTAQRRGQAAAINQQVNSNTIVNVVSQERIQQNPDVNAAESVARLPGITISRSNGEGSQVTVRGVSPRFNSVTVNGQRIPSTEAGNRSIDLSMVSSDILQGIEVFKALTPDKDGDAVGGTVNLVTRTAEEGFRGRVQFESGYHGLIDDIGTYRGSINLGSRFLNNKLGFIGTVGFFRANRNSDRFDANYEVQDVGADGEPIPNVSHIYLNNGFETRDRYSASGTFDYRLGAGQIVMDHFYSRNDRDVEDRNITLNPDRSTISYGYGAFIQNTTLNSTQLRGEHPFSNFTINWSASRSKSVNERPTQYGTGASQDGGFTSDLPVDAVPQEIPPYGKYELEETFGGAGFGWSTNKVEDEDLTAQVDIRIPFFVSNNLDGYFKFGGKIRHKERVRNNENYGINDGFEYAGLVIENYPEYSRLDREFYFENFIDPAYTGYEFPMGNSYVMPYVFDGDIIAEHYNRFQPIDSLWFKSLGPQFSNYDAVERITATYGMAEINIGSKMMLLPGVRFESTYNEYGGRVGFIKGTGGRTANVSDTTGNITRNVLMPMVHLKYQFTPQFSVRLAATKSLTRPDFLNLAPFERIDFGSQNRTVNRGSLDLEIPTAWNYDLFLTHFSKLGLISVGAFYKRIQDVDIDISFKDLSGTPQTNPTFGFITRNPINSERPTTVYGMEAEIQTNFYFLPKPFDGIVLSANFSQVRSETYFPFFPVVYPPPEYTPTILDTARVNSLPGQSNTIANVTLGYEKGGFSGRVSMNFQGENLAQSGASEFFDRYNQDYLRWDANMTYKFKRNWTILMSLINFTNTPERSYMWRPVNPTEEEYYGWQINLGLRYQFTVFRE